jgi:hypothetical protein
MDGINAVSGAEGNRFSGDLAGGLHPVCLGGAVDGGAGRDAVPPPAPAPAEMPPFAGVCGLVPNICCQMLGFDVLASCPGALKTEPAALGVAAAALRFNNRKRSTSNRTQVVVSIFIMPP